MLAALAIIQLSTKDPKPRSRRVWRRDRPDFSGIPRLKLTDLEIETLTHELLRIATLSRPQRKVPISQDLIPNGFVRASEKTRSIGIFSEENPVYRGHSVYWDEVCHRFCVHTTSFSGMYRD